jgi:general secretion pathway protein L
MKQHLVIQLTATDLRAESVLFWCVFNGNAVQASGRCALAALPAALADVFAGGETVVLVPGEMVLLTEVRIPSRQQRQIKQALPYMVEELIADNIEDVHMAIAPVRLAENGEIAVAVVRHQLLINWLDQFYQHGVRPDFLGPDSLAVPWRENSRGLFIEAERFIYRDGPCRAQVLFRAQLPAFLDLLKQQAGAEEIGAVPHYTLSCGADSAADAQALAATVQSHLDCEVDVTEYTESCSEVMAATALHQRGEMINLLQGGYQVQQHQQGQKWWRVALVAGIGLVLYGAVAGASGLWFNWRAQHVEQQTVSLYRELYPQERRVVSPKKQLLAHLRSQGVVAGGSPLPLLARTALGLRGSGVRIDELQYRQQGNELQMQMRAPSLEALDQVKQALGGVGLGVDINSATQQDSGTLGRVSIRESQS